MGAAFAFAQGRSQAGPAVLVLTGLALFLMGAFETVVGKSVQNAAPAERVGFAVLLFIVLTIAGWVALSIYAKMRG
jgi:hypothetical protein